MRCVICKSPSSSSEPREHILPEGLGNTDHILRRGVVCGKCNNYFASKVEKPFLELGHVIALRSDQGIPSKKGLVPLNRGILLPSGALIESMRDPSSGELQLNLSKEAVHSVLKMNACQAIFPYPALLEPNRIVSRFFGKVGLEAMAQRIEQNDEWLSEMTDNLQLDELRQHVRYDRIDEWPISIRRIYEANAAWTDDSSSAYQIVHEFDFLRLENNEIYFVIALFGQEFVINMGGPSLDGWLDWLGKNGNASPLHSGKNNNLETMLPL